MISGVMRRLPRVFVFDLDGCIWTPEMYELWGRGGTPFWTENGGKTLLDRSGTKIRLLGDIRSILHELKTDPKYVGCEVGVASTCDEPAWARECLRKFSISDDLFLVDVLKHVEIYKGNKAGHLKAIAKKLKVKPEEMIFFDNQTNNCYDVVKIGATVVFTPEGVTRSIFEEVLEKFPSVGTIIGPISNWRW